MADEEKTETTETVETKTDVENFAEKMDEVLKEAPAGDEIVSDETQVSDEETPASEETEEETPAVAGEELAAEDAETLKGIDPEVLAVCRDYGWDGKKIAQVAKISPELFDDVRELLDEEQKKETEKPPAGERIAETKRPEFEELKFALDPDVHGKEVVDAINKLAARQNEYGKGLSEEKGRLQSERDATYFARIDASFDKFTKELPILGNSNERLTKDQTNKRRELFAYASYEAKIKNIPIEKAIKNQVNREKNQDGEKAAEQRLLNKMENAKRFHTNKPTRRHSDLSTRKFVTPEEEKEAIMSEGYKEAGIEE